MKPPFDDMKQIAVTIEMNGQRFGFRQAIPVWSGLEPDGYRQWIASEMALTVEDAILENWGEA